MKAGTQGLLDTDYVSDQGRENPKCPPWWPDFLGDWQESDS